MSDYAGTFPYPKPNSLPIVSLEALVRHISPFGKSDERMRVIQALHAATAGTPDGLAIALKWSSQWTDFPGEAALAAIWNTAIVDMPAADAVATLCALVEGYGFDWIDVVSQTESAFELCGCEVGTDEASTQPQYYELQLQALDDIDAPDSDSAAHVPISLARYSLTINRDEVAKTAVEQDFIVGRIALSGQLTLINGPSNIGKSAIVNALIGQGVGEGRIDPEKCFVLDFDTDANGLLEKIDFASQHGFHVLSDHYLGFSALKFLEEMDNIVRSDQAMGVVLVLDTVKQHTSVMSKEQSAAFASKLRRYSKAGASVVALGHTNKNLNADGKPVHAGTTDLVEQFDACYLLYEIGVDRQLKTRTVMFDNFKARGPVAKQACYRYSIAEGLTYQELLDSVVAVEDTEVSEMQRGSQQRADAPVIDAIANCIVAGVVAKMELIASAVERSGASRRAVQAVLERYSGQDPRLHRWSFRVYPRGEKRFALLPQAEPAGDGDR